MNQPVRSRTDLDELKARIESLSPMGVRFVARLIDSLSHPPRAEVSKTWITANPEWVEYFGLTISVHHSSTIEPLGLISFEMACRDACEAVGWRMDEPGPATRRFVDATLWIDGESELKVSLKSTAAKRLSASTAHVSKLTEAAWIQDMRTARTKAQDTGTIPSVPRNGRLDHHVARIPRT